MTIFVEEAFIAEKAALGGSAFLQLFFKTQCWSSHSDEKRTRFDLQRRQSILSARMIRRSSRQTDVNKALDL